MHPVLSILDSIITKLQTGSQHQCIGTNKVKKAQNTLRITELPNEMSSNIDICSPVQILRILRACDGQIFSGWHEFENIYDFIPIINLIIRHLQHILADTTNNKIILSGCGTSGRLAFVISKTFNHYLTQNNYSPCFDYCIPGGDKSLLVSQDIHEDNVQKGVQDLQQCTNGAKQVLFIGITCGLSAPYVGAQIEYAMTQSNYITVLMGFNPAHRARNTPVAKWNNKTFRDICIQFSKYAPKTTVDINEYSNTNSLPKHMLLNPIFGPEAISGSTRMKSGSGTLILLHVICILGVYQLYNVNVDNNMLNEMIYNMLKEYEHIYREIYSYKYLCQLSKICKSTSDTLQEAKNKVAYLCAAEAASIIAFIDASEMWPTFGTELKRYRPYFIGGWGFIGNKEGDLTHFDGRFEVDAKYLDRETMTFDDLVIVIGDIPSAQLTNIDCKLSRICVHVVTDGINEVKQEESDDICVKLSNITNIRKQLQIGRNCNGLLSILDDSFEMFAMKLLLNAVSTAGHVLSGTVLHNRMINVRVANDKLFYRSIEMIQQFGDVNRETATECLLISNYGQQGYKLKKDDSVEKHILAARNRDKIVPTSIMLALQKSKKSKSQSTVDEMRQMLNRGSSLRKALKDFGDQ